MTVEQAITEGYEHWIYANDGFQAMQDLSDLLGEGAEYHFNRQIELVEKEPYHPAGISANDLLELIGDQIQNNHSDDSGDDTEDVADAVKSIDHAIVQPLIDEITKKLNGLNYYRSTGIPLTKQ